jgi:hypothetical protein
MTASMAIQPLPEKPRTSTDRVPGDPLTTIEDLAISLVFRVMSECRYDRGQQEYYDIASRLPPLKQLHHQVNEELRQFLEPYGNEPPEFTRFAAGHERIVYERYPTEISIETIRRALVLSGMRTPRTRRRALSFL